MTNTMTMPTEVKEYFSKGRRKIKEVFANDDFTLTITFDNNEIRIYDMAQTLQGDVFAPIRNIERFRDVHIDPHGSIAWDIDPSIDSEVVWSNKLDLCPDSCYIYSLLL